MYYLSNKYNIVLTYVKGWTTWYGIELKKLKNRQLLCLQNQGRFKEIKPSYEIRAVIAWDASSYC